MIAKQRKLLAIALLGLISLSFSPMYSAATVPGSQKTIIPIWFDGAHQEWIALMRRDRYNIMWHFFTVPQVGAMYSNVGRLNPAAMAGYIDGFSRMTHGVYPNEPQEYLYITPKALLIHTKEHRITGGLENYILIKVPAFISADVLNASASADDGEEFAWIRPAEVHAGPMEHALDRADSSAIRCLALNPMSWWKLPNPVLHRTYPGASTGPRAAAVPLFEQFIPEEGPTAAPPAAGSASSFPPEAGPASNVPPVAGPQ